MAARGFVMWRIAECGMTPITTQRNPALHSASIDVCKPKLDFDVFDAKTASTALEDNGSSSHAQPP